MRCTCILQMLRPCLLDGTPLFRGQSCRSSAGNLFCHGRKGEKKTSVLPHVSWLFPPCRVSVAPNQGFVQYAWSSRFWSIGRSPFASHHKILDMSFVYRLVANPASRESKRASVCFFAENLDLDPGFSVLCLRLRRILSHGRPQRADNNKPPVFVTEQDSKELTINGLN